MSRRGLPGALQPVEHRAVEGGRRPRPAQARAHVRGVGAVVRPAEAPRAVVLSPACGDVERARVRRRRRLATHQPPPGPHVWGGARGEGEARGRRRRRRRVVVVRAARGAVRSPGRGGGVGAWRLRPGGVSGRRAALLRGAVVGLEVGQRGDHGGDPGGGHVHGGRSRGGVVEESGLVGRGSVVGCHYALVHVLSLGLDIRVDSRIIGSPMSIVEELHGFMAD